MIRKEEIFKIGKLAKTHGIHGEIAFRFDSDIFDRVECPYLILKVDGIFVPFFMQEYRFKGAETALITFQDITDENQASKLQGLTVYFPRKYYNEQEDADHEATWDFFIGFTAIDKVLGKLGVITSVDTQTMNTLFLIKGDDGKSRIIPATEKFFLNIDTEKEELHLQLPEGLLD